MPCAALPVPAGYEFEAEEPAFERPVEEHRAPCFFQAHLVRQVEVGAQEPGGPAGKVAFEVTRNVVHQAWHGGGLRVALGAVGRIGDDQTGICRRSDRSGIRGAQAQATLGEPGIEPGEPGVVFCLFDHLRRDVGADDQRGGAFIDPGARLSQQRFPGRRLEGSQPLEAKAARQPRLNSASPDRSR